jgi:hypothetical protein
LGNPLHRFRANKFITGRNFFPAATNNGVDEKMRASIRIGLYNGTSGPAGAAREIRPRRWHGNLGRDAFDRSGVEHAADVNAERSRP